MQQREEPPPGGPTANSHSAAEPSHPEPESQRSIWLLTLASALAGALISFGLACCPDAAPEGTPSGAPGLT